MSERDCLESLLKRPKPLVSSELGIAVMWNAKAGCTFASKWLWYHEGRLSEVAAFHDWPHMYRQHVYYDRPGYEDDLRRIPALGARCVKFVRDPYRRAVSSYLHVSRQVASIERRPLRPLLRDAWNGVRHVASHPSGSVGAVRSGMVQARVFARQRRPPEMLALRRHLGRPVGPDEPFSFREFVGFLDSVDLDEADIHFRRQTSSCEREGHLPDITILRIEESGERLPALESTLGLSHSDQERLLESRHNTVRRSAERFVGDDTFGDTRGVPVPGADAFYDGALRDTVGRLYEEDFRRYGYARE